MRMKWSKDYVHYKIQNYKRKVLPIHHSSYDKARHEYTLYCYMGVKGKDFYSVQNRYNQYKKWLKDAIDEYKDLRRMLKECKSNGLCYVEFDDMR